MAFGLGMGLVAHDLFHAPPLLEVGRVAGHIRVTRPPVCWARRVAKRSATLCFGRLVDHHQEFARGAAAGLLMALSPTQLAS